MASASLCFHCITFACALLYMCAVHLSTGASQVFPTKDAPDRSPPKAAPNKSPVNISAPDSSPPQAAPNKSPVNISAPSPAPAPDSARSSSPHPSPSPSPAAAPGLKVSSPTPSLNRPERLRRRAGRILGLVLVSFMGMLQAFVVLFLLVKRRQMLKHMYGARADR